MMRTKCCNAERDADRDANGMPTNIYCTMCDGQNPIMVWVDGDEDIEE